MTKNKITAVLGPTNTGKTYLAIETMLSFESGMIGFPLRLLAREVYDKVIKKISLDKVALITGEEKIIPSNAKYFLCTVESMPIDKHLEFVGVDEIQMCSDHERGHIFTDRLLNMRGEKLTMLMGSSTIKNIISKLDGDIEFINRERLSKLTYAGHKKISRIDRKTAIIAFSAEEVYAIAELIRRQKGGAAIVMGSLSPKTRNAQVELYQSGDVDFLVATDAIGMGINMDLDFVYFSNVKKFDGKKLRRLNLSEIGQIAGRAGRYLNDGSFGITGDCKEISPEEVELLENHKFEEIRTLFWRNSNLNFNNPISLIKSLEEKPQVEWLRKIHECEDEKALKYFLKDQRILNIEFDKKIKNAKSLYDVKADKKLIVFWASWCPHCVKEIPHIKEFYPDFQSQGGEIIAVSLDMEKTAFDNATKDTQWINYSDLMKWESPIVKQYGISSTPTMILLDKDNNVVKIGSRVSEFL